MSVHLVSRENDFLGTVGTLFLPDLCILRCTRHPTVFLRWKQSLFFLFRKWKAYRGCTSSLHRANTTTLQGQEDGRKVRKVTEAKPELWRNHLSKKLSQMPPNIVNLYPPICIKKVLDENFGKASRILLGSWALLKSLISAFLEVSTYVCSDVMTECIKIGIAVFST